MRALSTTPGDGRPVTQPKQGARDHALWGGRFEGGLAPEMRTLNLSLDVDRRLWREDVRGSRAWARALVGAGVLSEEEGKRIDAGLERVAARLATGAAFDGAGDEDVHSLVERLLFEEAGDVAGKLHTGRSRNDQVATDLRMWGMGAGRDLEHAVADLCRALANLAERGVDVILPGYTHLQQGQPIRAAQWALAHLWAFDRDRERLRRAVDAAGALPLGSGAIAGCPFPVDRDALAHMLGFRRPSENSVDAVGDRDWALDLAYAGAMVGVHLSRLGEDLMLFTSLEFGFVRLADGYSTGSSLMPQKRNPDVAELARGKAGRLTGNLMALLTLVKGLPTGYNRDLQEDKRTLFDTADTLLTTVPAVAGAIATAEFRPERIRAVMDTQLLATDLADLLVRRGVPFRTSHEAVGRLVRRAEEQGVPLAELPVDAFLEVAPEFGEDVHQVFDWERSVESRAAPGGTARAAVEAQLVEARRRLAGGRGDGAAER
ncbi:MAG: argininosuccinate lyase [Gemmatimonadetes bacterium]|nr:argininosuccinate lyase [Gemmatimonadota bacterium]